MTDNNEFADFGGLAPATLSWLPSPLAGILVGDPPDADQFLDVRAKYISALLAWEERANQISRESSAAQVRETNGQLIVFLKLADELERLRIRVSFYEKDDPDRTYRDRLLCWEPFRRFSKIHNWHYRTSEKGRKTKAAYDKARLKAAKKSPEWAAKQEAKRLYDQKRYAEQKQKIE